MRTGIFLTVVFLLLGITSWLDDYFICMKLNKTKTLFFGLCTIALSPFAVEVVPEFTIYPATYAVLFITLCLFVYKNNRFVPAISSVMFGTGIALLGFFIHIPLAISVMVSSVICGIVWYMQYHTATLCGACVPLIVYGISLILECFGEVPFICPDVYGIFDIQIMGMAAGAVGAYAMWNIRKYAYAHSVRKEEIL